MGQGGGRARESTGRGEGWGGVGDRETTGGDEEAGEKPLAEEATAARDEWLQQRLGLDGAAMAKIRETHPHVCGSQQSLSSCRGLEYLSYFGVLFVVAPVGEHLRHLALFF